MNTDQLDATTIAWLERCGVFIDFDPKRITVRCPHCEFIVQHRGEFEDGSDFLRSLMDQHRVEAHRQ